MRQLGIGLAGTGFMGRAHAIGFRTVGGLFELGLTPTLQIVADVTEDAARHAAARMGFARAAGDWRTLVADQAVDLVAVATPNHLHAPISLAAIDRGKHVYCEKPLAPNASDAEAMMRAAERAGIVTAVGFNYLCNPMIALARDIVEAGEIGRVWSFRGQFNEEFMRDPEAPWTWRQDASAGSGALGDLGSHIVNMARFLLGPIDEVFADVETVVSERPVAGTAERRAVAVDDSARLLLRFARGCRGAIETSWLASGRRMGLGFEITGERGAIVFDQARLNELELYRVEPDQTRNGFRRICAGPEHPPYGAFCPAGGHQLGYNDLKVIEIRNLLAAIDGGPPPLADFREAWEVQRVIDAALQSSCERRWIRIG